MGKVKLLLLVVLAAFLTATTGFAGGTSFKAKLTPKNEVPSHKTKSSGKSKFKLSKDGEELNYTLRIKNIVAASAAHIHTGKTRANGPPLVGLLITEKDLPGDLQGKSLDDLAQRIKSGETYLYVHTDAFPDGEIRGHIK